MAGDPHAELTSELAVEIIDEWALGNQRETLGGLSLQPSRIPLDGPEDDGHDL